MVQNCPPVENIDKTASIAEKGAWLRGVSLEGDKLAMLAMPMALHLAGTTRLRKLQRLTGKRRDADSVIFHRQCPSFKPKRV